MPFVSVAPLVRLAFGGAIELAALAGAIEEAEGAAVDESPEPDRPAKRPLRFIALGALARAARRRPAGRSLRGLLAEWSAEGERCEAHCRLLARTFARRGLEWTLVSVAEGQAFQPLVDAVVSSLPDSPELRSFVDDIVRYLSTQPEMRVLIHEQSAQITTRLLDETRDRAMTADAAVDRVARGIFRKFPKRRR